jgi:hypothetical protein
MQPREKERLSNYDRSIMKYYQKKGTCRSTIPQLGQQFHQSIPPLQVLSKEDEAMADFMLETKPTKAQLRVQDHIPIHPGLGIKQFVLGEPLIWPELLKMLPTRIYGLHRWYLKASKDGYKMIAARVKDSLSEDLSSRVAECTRLILA